MRKSVSHILAFKTISNFPLQSVAFIIVIINSEIRKNQRLSLVFFCHWREIKKNLTRGEQAFSFLAIYSLQTVLRRKQKENENHFVPFYTFCTVLAAITYKIWKFLLSSQVIGIERDLRFVNSFEWHENKLKMTKLSTKVLWCRVNRQLCLWVCLNAIGNWTRGLWISVRRAHSGQTKIYNFVHNLHHQSQSFLLLVKIYQFALIYFYSNFITFVHVPFSLQFVQKIVNEKSNQTFGSNRKLARY